MSISFQCPQCGKNLKAPESAVGQSSRCPGCGATVTCPEPIFEAEIAEMQAERVPGMTAQAVSDGDDAYALLEPIPAAAPGTLKRRPCPMCGEMIVATAAKCRYCGEVFRAIVTEKRGEELIGLKSGKKEDLRKVAAYQKYLTFCILVQLLSFIGFIGTAVASGPAARVGPAYVLGMSLFFVFLITGVVASVFALMLALKVFDVVLAILLVLVAWIPCLGLVPLFLVYGQATNVLKNNGYSVGFLGANLAEF